MEYYRTLHSNTKEQTINTRNNTDASPKNHAKWKSNTKGCVLCDSISMKLQRRQNQVTKQISGRRGTGGGEGDVSAKGPVGAFSGDGILLPLSCGGGYTIITKTH